MLGNAEEIENNLAPADSTDLNKLGYKDIEGFVEKADGLCQHLLRKGTNQLSTDTKEARVFAFAESKDEFDMLVSKGDSLVYTSKEKIFVSRRNKTVLKSPEQIVVSSEKGKTVIIANDKCLVERRA